MAGKLIPSISSFTTNFNGLKGKFEYWFKHYKKNWNIMFLSSSVRDEEGMINFAGIILRNDNPRLKQIVNEFTDTVTLLNDKPTR